MGIPIRICCLWLILVLSAGCSITSGRCYWKGNEEVKQSDHVVKLDVSTEGMSFMSEYGADCFVLNFANKNGPVSVDSIEGTYQFYSENMQPLELTSSKGSIAVFVPRSNIVTKSSSKTLAHVGCMRFGRYKLDIKYRLNGREYSCHFDVDYGMKATPELHGLWELKDVN